MGKLLPPANVSYSCYTGDTPIVMTNGSSANISYHGIISLTQLRVQAFDIKNGDLSPGLAKAPYFNFVCLSVNVKMLFVVIKGIITSVGKIRYWGWF